MIVILDIALARVVILMMALTIVKTIDCIDVMPLIIDEVEE